MRIPLIEKMGLHTILDHFISVPNTANEAYFEKRPCSFQFFFHFLIDPTFRACVHKEVVLHFEDRSVKPSDSKFELNFLNFVLFCA